MIDVNGYGQQPQMDGISQYDDDDVVSLICCFNRVHEQVSCHWPANVESYFNIYFLMLK